MLVARILFDPKSNQPTRFECFNLLVDLWDKIKVFPRISDNEARHDVLWAYFKRIVLVVFLVFIKNLCEIIEKNPLKRRIQSFRSVDVRCTNWNDKFSNE